MFALRVLITLACVGLGFLIAQYRKQRRSKKGALREGDGTWELAKVVSAEALAATKKSTTRSRTPASPASPTSTQKKPRCVVVGGSGFLGQNLARRLKREDRYVVRIADIRPPRESGGLSDVEFVKTDLCNLEQVRAAIQGADVVFHCATAAPTAANEHNHGLMYSVNVIGTRNLLHACAEGGVGRFVFTSSASVVFDGSPLNGGDESMPYARVHIDYYNETKEEAERCVLGANGVCGMRTVALRPSGIFGEDDPQMTPIIVEQARAGKAKFIVGDGKNLFDFTYVGNVCQAHTMAAEALLQDTVCGKAYFITNADPQPFWRFLGQMLEGLGYPASQRPHKHMPLWFIMPLAHVAEFIKFCLSPVVQIHSNLSVTRMLLASCNRHISCARAKRDFGYVPEVSIQDALKRTVEHFSHLRYQPK